MVPIGPMGPKGPMGPIGPMVPSGPMVPIWPCSPIGRKGGSLAHTSSLARVDANLNLYAALSAKGHTNSTSTSMRGVASLSFGGHACAVQFKSSNCNALPVPFAKTGYLFAVLGGPKRVPKKVPKKGPKMDPTWTPKWAQREPTGR